MLIAPNFLNLNDMSLIKRVSGVLIEKKEKIFEDGTRGAYCQFVDIDENLSSFWCPESLLGDIGEPHDVEGFDVNYEKIFKISTREWDGKEKRTLVSVE